MKAIKKLFWAVSWYIYVTWALLLPVFLVLLWFDFVFDLQIQLFDSFSALRIVFYVWFLIVNIAYFWGEHKEAIKKFL